MFSETFGFKETVGHFGWDFGILCSVSNTS